MRSYSMRFGMIGKVLNLSEYDLQGVQDDQVF